MPMPKFYYDITLLFADSEKDFPVDFEAKKFKKVSREGFLRVVERDTVVALEDFDPEALREQSPLDVELRDGATYIVIPTGRKSFAKRVSSYAAFRICGRFSSRH